MTRKTTKPAPLATGTGLGNALASSACISENSEWLLREQAPRATKWLARRAHLSLSVASAIAAANHWGRL